MLRPVAFLLLIFVSITLSSSSVNCPSLVFSCDCFICDSWEVSVIFSYAHNVDFKRSCTATVHVVGFNGTCILGLNRCCKFYCSCSLKMNSLYKIGSFMHTCWALCKWWLDKQDSACIWHSVSHFYIYYGFQTDSWNVLSTSVFVYFGWQLLFLLLRYSSFCSLHFLTAMQIVIVYLTPSFLFYWSDLECILVVLFSNLH